MTITGDQKAKILSCLSEISNSYTRIEAERDLVKEILDRMQEEFEVPKKLGRKLARTYHKRSFEEEVAQQNDFVDTYEALQAK
jgi:asparagine synthetase B (glutamine-hydrolysing)